MNTSIWDRLENSVPVNRAASRLTRRLPDQENGAESASQQIMRLEKENLLLQQENEWYMQSQIQAAHCMLVLCEEISRLRKAANNGTKATSEASSL